MNKRITLCGNTSWYLYNFRRSTIEMLLLHGFSVHLISSQDEFTEKLVNMGCTFNRIEFKGSRLNPLKEIKLLTSFYLSLKKSKTDLLLNFTPKCNIYGSLSARILKLKVINNISGLGSVFISKSVLSFVVKVLYRISQKNACCVFFQNDEDMNFFLTERIIKEDQVRRIPGSGVNLGEFKISQSDDDGVTRFLLAARLIYDKGIFYYAQAARILRKKYGSQVEFFLMGFHDYENPSTVSKKEIEKWQSEGFLKYDGYSSNMKEKIKKFDCIVLPSFYREGVPKILLEAAGMGKPLITTDNTGCRDAVTDEVSGYLCQVKSTDSLVEKLDKIISLGHERRIEMGLKGRVKMENEFDERIVLDAYRKAVFESFPNY